MGFSYRRRGREVFERFDWSVRPGEVTMLLGPNGAGKSTLLRLLCGSLRPTRGAVLLDGDPSRAVLRQRVGWMPQDIQPARGMTAAEQVEYVAWLAGRPRRDARRAAWTAIEQVDLADQARTRASELSGGQLRRLGLAQTLAQGGSVLLLDEPTAGLDPAQALGFREVLRRLDTPGGVVVSTHQATDLASDVDRVVVLVGGAIGFEGTTDEFRRLVPVGDDVMARAYAQVLTDGRP
uniref:ABC transporter ATP-binding protein n=1 Tax=Nocardioides stalactiti TaxID=2755356 RepID=UPI00248420CB